jgi:hypothetical protein
LSCLPMNFISSYFGEWIFDQWGIIWQQSASFFSGFIIKTFFFKSRM